MSHAFYDNLAGLRTWRSSELRQRRRIADQLVETAETTLAEINPAWRFEEVEAPTMMPVERMSSAYTSDDIFLLQDAPGGSKQWAMRAETTDGSYLAAVELLRNTNLKVPLAVWQMGKSYRRETNTGPRRPSCGSTSSRSSRCSASTGPTPRRTLSPRCVTPCAPWSRRSPASKLG
ncbi:hypothetical protein [uncultured Salinicola sp.]|mgnify:CR=1 FL=1|uniref:hypothetical protein n=1 Tax=uncultured Salinicola sp. TaxID=1193542 RepID=UPI00260AD4A9|nr:hypothetical protein [uncultured Salinicola sp.]|tara:strand:- start:37 stop:564 length:528 start_codon:yes stop_codon:yes gene_type:complete